MDELIKRIKSGDMSGWDALVAKYQQKALNFAHRMLRDRFEAEDAVQEAFIKAFDKIVICTKFIKLSPIQQAVYKYSRTYLLPIHTGL